MTHHAPAVSGSQLIRNLAILHTNSHLFIFFFSKLLYNDMNMYKLCASPVLFLHWDYIGLLYE